MSRSGKNSNKWAAMVFLAMLFCTGQVVAVEVQEHQTVFKASVEQPMEVTYAAVYKALEEARFYVVFEPDIGANLSRMAKRWGEDYNRSDLSGLKSMVFCNGWYANKVSNLDPDMLGVCPLHLTLVEREAENGVSTTVLFNRPTMISGGSAAHEVIQRIEAEVVEAIMAGLEAADKTSVKK